MKVNDDCITATFTGRVLKDSKNLPDVWDCEW